MRSAGCTLTTCLNCANWRSASFAGGSCMFLCVCGKSQRGASTTSARLWLQSAFSGPGTALWYSAADGFHAWRSHGWRVDGRRDRAWHLAMEEWSLALPVPRLAGVARARTGDYDNLCAIRERMGHVGAGRGLAGAGLLLAQRCASDWRHAADCCLCFGPRDRHLVRGPRRPVVEKLIDAAKGRSIRFRLENENIIVRNVRQRPVFGWGRQTGSVDNPDGRPAVRDSLWVIVYAQCGAVGLASIVATLLVPVAVFIRHFPAGRWQEAAVGPAAGLAVVLILYAIDDLANAMNNPVFMLTAGGFAGLGRERSRACHKITTPFRNRLLRRAAQCR